MRRLRPRVGRDLARVGATARRVSSSASGSWPQTQIGSSGGQMHPRARPARKRLTRPILERVEGDRGQPAAGAQQVPGSGQRLVELGELVVDGDPQRLEGPPGRMAAGELRRDRHRRLDHLDKLLGGVELLASTRADDRPRDLGGVALLAVLAQQARQPALVPGVDDLLRRELLRRGPSACPAARRRRRRSRAPRCRPASRTCRGPGRRGRRADALLARAAASAVDEVGADEPRVAGDLGGELGEPLLGDRVAVDPDQRAGRPDPVGDQPGVTASAERAVDGGLAGPRVEQSRSARRRGPGCASWSCQVVSPRLAAMSGIRAERRSIGLRSACGPRPPGTRPSRSPRRLCRGRRSS